MLYGVKINGVDTLQKYGLALLADYNITAPKLRENCVVIPGVDGCVDLGSALTGFPVYDNRTITFKLFKGVDDVTLDAIRRGIMALYHGQEVTVEFPFDSEHTYSGTLQFGDMGGYNSGTIPVTMNAAPWRTKKTITEVARSDLSSSYKTLTLQNEGRRVVPTITCGQETTLLYKNKTFIIAADTAYKNYDLVLQQGKNSIKAKIASGTSGTITIKYQEAAL